MELTHPRVGVLAGGGLSSWTVARALAMGGCDLIVYLADVGQRDERCLDAFLDDMATLGVPVRRVDLRAELGTAALEVARAGAQYEGGYWNTTGTLRSVLVSCLAPVLIADECGVLAHGSVGGGNDDRRFERLTASVARTLQVYSPWRDAEMLQRFDGRSSMVDFLQKYSDCPALELKREASTDGSLMGVSHESRELEDLTRPWLNTAFVIGRSPREALEESIVVRLGFEGGRLLEVDGHSGSDQALLDRANHLAGNAGVGLMSVVENRLNGTKCRGVYEAPGMTLLGFAHDQLARLGLSAATMREMHASGRDLGVRIYAGGWCEEATQAVRTTIARLQESLSGIIEVELYKGNLVLRSARCLRAEVAQQVRFTRGGHVWEEGTP